MGVDFFWYRCYNIRIGLKIILVLMNMVFFTADLHIGHRAICKYRTQFTIPQEHDEYIIQMWNETITKAKHQVWVLGDMFIKNKYYDFDDILKKLHGTIRLISGNHDYMPAYFNKKILIQTGLVKKYGFWLSHCPIHPQELRNHKNIHGHIHGIDNQLNDDRYINVNCEFWNYKPVSLEYLKSLP